MMGIIIENSHLKAGKFKPWIFRGVILNSLVIICLFTVRPEGWGFVAFFGVGYLLWGMTYTMNDIAYWGMLPSLTSDPGERNWLVTVQGIFICIGQFSVAGLLPLPKSVVLLNIIGFLIFFSQGAFNMTMIVMLNNTIEYDEVRFHERHDSIISAVRSFATKLASAVDQAVVALILIISNIYAISQKISGLEIKGTN